MSSGGEYCPSMSHHVLYPRDISPEREKEMWIEELTYDMHCTPEMAEEQWQLLGIFLDERRREEVAGYIADYYKSYPNG